MGVFVRRIIPQPEDNRDKKYVQKLISEYLPLGIGMNGSFGWTINLPARQQMKALLVNAKKRIKIRWENCTPDQQIQYFVDCYLDRVVKPLVGNAIAIPELTKAGNIHLHLLCWNDGGVNDYDMACLRKTAFQTCFTLHKGKHRHGIHLNYIHPLQDPLNWLEYLIKDLYKHTLPIILITDK